ncbi:hypothetical protein [Pseudomonas sp. CC6-YY-74]|uniref:hypothetical protein n=1 Tax=Pseudomonas sp. CC6-YY-74 TaxID=1930532 RepID=UPI0009A197DC|nr:hypothetical protein [Pseudomonas sp. CC6-YY-74]
MMLTVVRALRWVVSLGAKFARVVPLQTFIIVCATLLSQISTLLANFLPLKVVILLGSERIPRYFPESLAALDWELLIGALCLGTLGFYLLHLLAERLIRAITAMGAQRLLQRSHKMALFDNQDELARDAYSRFSRALASGVFIALALVGLGYFYPIMALVLLGYTLLAWALVWLLYRLNEGFRQKLENNLASVLAVAAGLGFFVAFGYLVADFILWIPPGVIIGIVALLLSRQVMQRMGGMVGDLASLRRQQIKLDALFFHGRVLLPMLAHDKSEYLNLLAPSNRRDWVSALMREFTSWQGGELDIRWQQTGVASVAALLVEVQEGRFLIKLYDPSRRTLALHESTLASEALPGLPALRLRGVTQVVGVHCLLYVLPEGSFVGMLTGKRMRIPLIASLMHVQPSEALIKRYKRSRPFLWQRLRAPLLLRLQVAVVDAGQQQQLDRLLAVLPQLIGILQRLPLWIFTPDTGFPNIYQCEESGPVLLNWGRWSMEPLGAGWPVVRLDDLAEMLGRSQAVRQELAGSDVCQVELAALCAALEAGCNRQLYSDAVALLPALLERLDVVSASVSY